ncbi:glycosyltransferase [uncultured Aliiroseovarius sp.]|uniref:glycosyltransferase n=1 Tax=uncultured Aliiroseovarius sp. TaxID=1658783 RepID=UPI002628F4CE|nr:glycosyltransferase [uncultured Aliiroseovarius sp.]
MHIHQVSTLPDIPNPCNLPGMKVIHVVTTTNVGGAQIMLQRYLSALGENAASHSVISLVPSGPIAPDIEALGVQVADLGLSPGRVTPAALWRLRRLLRDAKPDIVHGWMYHGCLAAWAGLIGNRRKDGPALVWGVHHSLQDIANEKRSTRWVVRLMAAMSKRVDLITYCSGVSQDQHEAIGFCKDNVDLIPNAVDTEVFKPDPDARARLGAICKIPDGRLIVGNVARGHPMKDHVSMVRATAMLIEMGHDVQAVLVGEGLSDSPAVQTASELGIRDRVTALETRSDVHSIVPGFDIFLLSSAWGEAFPLAVAEAMAAGVPCVVTDVGDCALLVGDTGRVVAPAAPQEQAKAVASLIDAGQAARNELGQRARARVSEHFSAPRYVDRHDAAYARALNRATGKGADETQFGQASQDKLAHSPSTQKVSPNRGDRRY